MTLAATSRGLGDLVSPLFYRYVDGRVRRRRRSALVSLLKTEHWSIEQLRDLQERLLRRLLTHAVTTSAWYRGKLDGADPSGFGLDDLPRLPVLERSDVQNHLDEIAGLGASAPDSRVEYSSGSTGTPMRVYQSQEYRDWYAAARERGYLMCKPFRFGMPRAFFWGSDVDSRAHRGAAGTLRDVLVNMMWFDAFAVRGGLPAAIRRLRVFRPALVVGYVSMLTEVARALDRPLEGLGAVETAAETLTGPERRVIADGFGAPVFNKYTTREVGTLAHECEAHDGLHVVMENTVVEVVDAEGRPLTNPGDEGEILVTSLRESGHPADPVPARRHRASRPCRLCLRAWQRTP